MSLNPSLPNHVINRVQVVPSWIDYHKKQGLGSAATAVRFRLLIDQFNDQSDEDGEQQGCSTDYCPQWGQAPGKFDYTIAEQVDGDECEDQEKNPIYSRRSTCIRENLSRDRIQSFRLGIRAFV